MAINRNLLLPSASSSSAIVRKSFNASSLASIKGNKKELNLSPGKTSLKDLLSSINKTVKNINIIVKKTTLSQSKAYKDGLKEARLANNAERERKLEEKKKDDPKQKPERTVPGLGFLDRIKRFLFFTFLGWLTNKYWDKLPKVLEFAKKLTPIIGVIETIGGALFNGVVNFIDTGYKVYDGLRDFTKQIGGENFQKTFDDFSKNLNTFINIAIIAGMATMGGSDFGSGKKPGQNSRRTSIRGSSGTPGRSRYGTNSDAARRYSQRFGRNAAVRRFGQEGVESLGGRHARSQTTNLARKGAVSVLGKGRTKAALRIVQPLVRNIPLIGGIMEFVLSWMSGDSPGKAAFKGIGAGLGTWVGGALGSLIPIPGVGTAIGMYLGSQGGSALGEALYDKIFENKEPSKKSSNQPKKKARGGITRGGKQVAGNVGRTLKIQRTIRKNLISPKPTKITPGIDVGGENKVKSLFPEPDGGQSGSYKNPFGFLYDSTSSMGNVPYIGPLFSLFGKLILGQSPKSADYKIISLALTAWINNAISQNLLSGNSVEKMLKEMPAWIELSTKKLVDSVAISVLNGLKENLLLKPLREMFSSTGLPPGELGDASDLVGGTKLLMDAGFPLKGAAYLSGNIQQESGWKGQRTPWVLDDGAGTNKGLVSWNRGRIVNAEKFLGKALNEASNADQVRWIKHEMEKSYPEAYRIFMNPDSSESELERASYIYLGYGEVGARFKYAKEALKRLEKGETGTYKASPSKVDMGSISGSLQSAKELAESMGLILTSSKRDPRYPGDKSLHISGRAMDFSNVPQGTRGSAEMDKFAKEMIKRHGSKLTQLIYTPLGYGIANGKKVDLSYWGDDTNKTHHDHVHVAYKDGGMIGPNKPRNIKPLEGSASYDEGYTILIQPVIIEKPVPVMNNKINFSGGGSVNINKDKSSLFIR
jgi:hypothetical protein